MTKNDIKAIAEMMVSRHGVGASLLAYREIVRSMGEYKCSAAENWCAVLMEIEHMLNRR